MTNDELKQLLDKFAADLGEHFDSVQILASRVNDGGETYCLKRGIGNWYARQGMATEFINQNQADELSGQIAQKLSPPDDEQWKQNS